MSIGRSLAITVERLTRPVEGVHRSIAGGWFSVLEPAARPVRLAHDAISSTVYSAVRQGAKLAGRIVDATLEPDAARDDAGEALVRGVWGDDPETSGTPEVGSMSVRDRSGTVIAFTSGGEPFPGATSRIVVLVHGLGDTERRWHRTEDAPGLIDAIDADPHLTAIAIRYNTGLHVSTNGSMLAELLEKLAALWPVPIESICLVGHSMGGLVARSAIATGSGAGHEWVGAASDLVTIGTPHRGSPLEKLANVAAWGLRVAPVTAPIADFIDSRSSGIKDLRFGSVLEHDWRDHDPDALVTNTVVTGPPHPGVRHHFVAGLITSSTTNPLGRLVGDLVVRPNSSSGPMWSNPAEVMRRGGVVHGNLPRDRRVIAQIMAWLTAASTDLTRASR